MVRINLGSGRAPVGKLLTSLFLMIFFVAGLAAEYFVAKSFIRTLGTYRWEKTECTILSSKVREESSDNEEPYIFEVSYEYTYQSIKHVSNRYRFNFNGSDGYNKHRSLMERYKEGTTAYCFVNGKRPSEAVLKRESLFKGFNILFPLVFIVVGGGGIYSVWSYKGGEKESISARGSTVKKKWSFGGFLFFFIFFAVGLVSFNLFFIRPVINIINARDWYEVECRVISGDVRSHEGDDGTTYSVDIVYEYEFNGEVYKSNRYNFFSGSSSGHKGKKAIVDEYLTAKNPRCYVNPDEPWESVLNRSFTWMVLVGLLPLIFVAVGAGGMIRSMKGSRNGQSATVEIAGAGAQIDKTYADTSNLGYEDISSESIVLKSKHSPLTKLLVKIFAAAICNGAISIFVVNAIQNYTKGNPNWVMMLFLIPFVLLGIGLICSVFYSFLSLFNPRPRLILRPGIMQLGDAAELQWEIFGKVQRISEFSIKLKGHEEATYRRGTDTCTDKETFYEMELFSMSDWMQMQTGEVGVVIPPDTMHTFKADNNKVIWSLEVHGDIKRWPDLKEEFEIKVVPGEAG